MELPPFALERYFAPREHAARFPLSCSDCESLALDALVADADDDLRDAWRALRLGYGHTRGDPALRAAIAARYERATADDVLTCAPSEGIFLALSTLLAPGDRVVVAQPAYQSLHEIARARGCDVLAWRPVEQPDGWLFDPDDLRALLRGGAKAVVVNFPHNPTGAQPSRGEWTTIVDAVAAADAWLFADEMYRYLESDDARLPSVVDVYDKGVALGGLSKAFGAPGLRAGWLACRDRAALDAAAARKDYTTICGGVVDELLAVMVLRRADAIAAANRALVAANLRALADAALPWTATPPRAGCTALARLPADESAAALCDAAFREASVLLLPSTVFDMGDRHVRLGLGRRSFPAALAAYAAWIRRM